LADTLAKRAFLVLPDGALRAKSVKVPGIGTRRLYHITKSLRATQMLDLERALSRVARTYIKIGVTAVTGVTLMKSSYWLVLDLVTPCPVNM
jgi:hypothetical protein